ncbi:MAG: MCE family protein [bacterium]|nr:MCE family protein [bacterium]
MTATIEPNSLPTAQVVPVKRSWAWLLPVLAIALAGFLTLRLFGGTGRRIVVRVEEGHGIKQGAALRFRGIDVGRVEELRLATDLSEVELFVRLEKGAESLARSGSRFWVVRPKISLDSVQGVDTVVGARYLSVLPGPADARRQDEFVGLIEAPVIERVEPGGLEITLESPERYSLAPGAPLFYRQIQVGTVLSVGLSTDATGVEVRAYVRPAYVQLVREKTRFFEVGGVEVDLTLMGGLKIDMESLRSLIVGGIALVTPPEPGDVVSTGHRFVLHGGAEEEWLTWQPALPVGSALLPPGTRIPPALRASLTWQRGRLIKREGERQGWVLPVAGGLIGPANLLHPEEEAREGTFAVAGETFALTGAPVWEANGLARVELAVAAGGRWDEAASRPLGEVEDCLVFCDPAAPPRALSSARLEVLEEGGWAVDPALAFDPTWHGGCVLARGDGSLVGMLLVGADGARVAPLRH